MSTAPAFDCTACGRRIGKSAGHNVTTDARVLCTRCLSDPRLHAQFFPTCPHNWHDMFDHTRHVVGTRAGTAWVLGLWPKATP